MRAASASAGADSGSPCRAWRSRWARAFRAASPTVSPSEVDADHLADQLGLRVGEARLALLPRFGRALEALRLSTSTPNVIEAACAFLASPPFSSSRRQRGSAS